MKKLLASCLAVVMLITLLGGCGEKTEKPEDERERKQRDGRGRKD